MERKVIQTEDGSSTIYIEEMNEHYHSHHGAIQEAEHVFLKNGFHAISANPVRIFEMGFGTGLNALLTYREAQKYGRSVVYETIEAFPVSKEMVDALNFIELIGREFQTTYHKMHEIKWNEAALISPFFSLTKYYGKLEVHETKGDLVDLVYYDAFGPRAQSELWTVEALSIIKAVLKPGGMLVTYCAQGQFKRNLKALGFDVQSLSGPPGKREMTRAIKL